MRRANPPSRREKPEAAKKILLGGVFPAGDMVKAAELRYAVESLRRVFPKAELHIAGENGVPAYGFPGGVPVEQLRETIRQYDAFGWIGTPVSGGELMPGAELLEFASHHGVAAFVWGVGLERGATAESGAERGRGGVFSRLAKLAGLSFFRRFGERKQARARHCLEHGLRTCRFAAAADAPSLEELRRYQRGVNGIAGADSLLLATSAVLPSDEFLIREGRMAAVAFGGREAIPPGTCALLERMAEELKVRFLLVAESPEGRSRLEKLRSGMARADEVARIGEFHSVEELLGGLGCCDLVIGNSFPVILLGLNKLIPAIGVGCGRRAGEYLERFRLPHFAAAEPISERLVARAGLLLEYGEEFQDAALPVREALLEELTAAERALSAALTGNRRRRRR